ncbi:MAG: YbaK/EbsC family protein [Acidimicrobiales bacterium]
MTKSDASARFAAAARAAGVDVEPIVYPDCSRTAVDAARAVGCAVAQIVKSLVLVGPEGPLLVLTAGDHRVDVDRLGELVGGEVRMATPDEVRAASGFAIGGTPPFGHPEPVATFLDPSLLRHEVVHAAAGTPSSCFPIDPATLLRVTDATVSEAVFADLDPNGSGG